MMWLVLLTSTQNFVSGSFGTVCFALAPIDDYFPAGSPVSSPFLFNNSQGMDWGKRLKLVLQAKSRANNRANNRAL